MASADLTGLVLPPPLDGESAEGLEALVEAGGAGFDALLHRWRTLLRVQHSPVEPSAARRSEAVLSLVAEAQARRILAGRGGERPMTPPPDPGALARQRGALAACCAALRIPRLAAGESAARTVARLRAASEASPSAAVPPPASALPAVAATETAASSTSAAPLLSSASLSAEEHATLARVADALAVEYSMRHAMLLKRLEVRAASPLAAAPPRLPVAEHPAPLPHLAGDGYDFWLVSSLGGAA